MHHCCGKSASITVPFRFLQERKKLLSFVIVGGGPTGVEVAAELHDMIEVGRGAIVLQLSYHLFLSLRGSKHVLSCAPVTSCGSNLPTVM